MKTSMSMIEKNCLLSWYPSPIHATYTINDIIHTCIYFSAEQYILVEKALLFDDHKTAKKIILAPTAYHARALDQEIKNVDHAMWQMKHYEIMYTAHMQKFLQNDSLRTCLYSTNSLQLDPLVQHIRRDLYDQVITLPISNTQHIEMDFCLQMLPTKSTVRKLFCKSYWFVENNVRTCMKQPIDDYLYDLYNHVNNIIHWVDVNYLDIQGEKEYPLELNQWPEWWSEDRKAISLSRDNVLIWLSIIKKMINTR